MRTGGFVWLASYPKSGNTWLRLALQSLLADGAPVDFAGRSRFAPLAGTLGEIEVELDVEASDLTAAELDELLPGALLLAADAVPETQFRKVHDCWGRTASGRLRFPPEATRAAVHVVRDPRDVAVSWAHHAAIDLDESISFLANPAAIMGRSRREAILVVPQPLSSWSGHAESWLAADPAPLTLRYEDMLADPRAALERVAAHCGLTATPAALDGAVAATRFDRLRAAEAEHGFRMGQAEDRIFFRRGVAGGWRDTLTAAQAARIVRDHGAMMDRLGYDR